jgi:hypothetical protein
VADTVYAQDGVSGCSVTINKLASNRWLKCTYFYTGKSLEAPVIYYPRGIYICKQPVQRPATCWATRGTSSSSVKVKNFQSRPVLGPTQPPIRWVPEVKAGSGSHPASYPMGAGGQGRFWVPPSLLSNGFRRSRPVLGPTQPPIQWVPEIEAGSGFHPAFYPMGTGGSLSRSRAAAA